MAGSKQASRNGVTPEPTGKPITMAAVGRLAGVSQVTVSRALSDPSKVSAETLRRINEAIELTGFVPNALAGALVSRRSMLISALVPSIANIVYASMVRAFGERMRAAGYELLLSETGPDPAYEEKAIRIHLSRRPDAVMLTGIHHTASLRRTLLSAAVPVVELWDITEAPIDICVGFSHLAAGKAVAEFAIQNAYRQVAIIHAGDLRALRRGGAFAERFRELGGESYSEINLQQPASLGGGRRGLARLLDETGFMKGLIFCSSDLLAHGVVIEAQARGLHVPQDIAVVGFGGERFSRHTEPALTTVQVDREELGRQAANALLARIEGGLHDRAVYDLGFELVRRGSA